MQVPIEIAFHNMDPSPAIEARVREKVAELEKRHEHMTNCRVVIESPHRRGRKGKLYEVKIDISVPGKEIVVSRAGPKNHAHEDVYVAIRDSFNAARRRLEEHTRTRRGEVKSHESPTHGRVAKLLVEEGYGFIETPDGQEVYFHRNSVLNNAFESLKIGGEVRYAEEMGDKGTQASTVVPIGKHHLT